ncbi:CotS family spore coat protein [Clostridium sp.]|uniref:CotS family spore coat protein n=1 Tax=Clostridium sp. TaxID=1506 RepID=UPI002FC63A3A
MLDSKNKERETLSRYDLDLKLLNNYDFVVSDVIPVRKVFILVTNKGNKILKRVEYNLAHLEFINSIIEHLRGQGFCNVMNYERNKKGDIYTQWKESTYVVMKLVEGRECEFNNPVELSIVTNTLAKMHLASKGFNIKIHQGRYVYGDLVEKFQHKLQELKTFKTMVLTYENKSDFDKIFLNHVDKFIEDMKKSIDIIKGSKYYELLEEKDKFAICHHDLAYHNILMDNDEASFIDFDYAIVDLRVHDLCNFINKVVKNFAYDFEKLKDIIGEYNKVSLLDPRELDVLYGMLWFPDGFYSISKDYYCKRKLWGENSFNYKLAKKVENLHEREEMLRKFKESYEL